MCMCVTYNIGHLGEHSANIIRKSTWTLPDSNLPLKMFWNVQFHLQFALTNYIE